LRNNPDKNLQEDLPDLNNINSIVQWRRQPDKQYELSRAQVAADRLLIHSVKLEQEYDAYISAGAPHNVKYTEKSGMTQTDITEIRRELNMEASLGLDKLGINIGAKLGYSTTETQRHELAINLQKETEIDFTLPPEKFARRFSVYHAADVIKVYAISTGDTVAKTVNATTHRALFLEDLEGGTVEPYQLPSALAAQSH